MSSPWTLLGIAPTRDRAEVRRAYAARLKLTNPEDDPEGFQALRRAYESALAYVSSSPRRQPEPAINPAPATPDVNPPPTSGVVTLDAQPALPVAEPDPFAAHWDACRRLHAWLAEAPRPDATQKKVLQDLLASPVLDHVGVRAQTEQGLARMILELAPRADGIIGPASAFFGWELEREGWARSAEVNALAQRWRVKSLLEQARGPGSRYREAYDLLRKPPPAGFQGRLAVWRHGAKVKAFLTFLNRTPAALGEFDPEAIAFWGKALGAARVKRTLNLFGKVFRIVRLALVGDGLVMLLIGFGIAMFNDGAVKSCRDAVKAHAPPARQLCDHAAEGDPANVVVEIARGVLFLDAGQDEQARQAFDLVVRKNGDPQALFGRGVARSLLDDEGGNVDKLSALRADPAADALFRARNLPADALMVYDKPPAILSQPPKDHARALTPGARALTPSERLQGPVTIYINCKVTLAGALRDCKAGPSPDTVRTPQEPIPSPFLESTISIARLGRYRPATFKGAPVGDAPIHLSMTFRPASRPERQAF